jgi:hypothetical protein
MWHRATWRASHEVDSCRGKSRHEAVPSGLVRPVTGSQIDVHAYRWLELVPSSGQLLDVPVALETQPVVTQKDLTSSSAMSTSDFLLGSAQQSGTGGSAGVWLMLCATHDLMKFVVQGSTCSVAGLEATRLSESWESGDRTPRPRETTINQAASLDRAKSRCRGPCLVSLGVLTLLPWSHMLILPSGSPSQ